MHAVARSWPSGQYVGGDGERQLPAIKRRSRVFMNGGNSMRFSHLHRLTLTIERRCSMLCLHRPPGIWLAGAVWEVIFQFA